MSASLTGYHQYTPLLKVKLLQLMAKHFEALTIVMSMIHVEHLVPKHHNLSYCIKYRLSDKAPYLHYLARS